LLGICLDSIKMQGIYRVMLQFARDILRFYKDARNIQDGAAICERYA